MYSLIFLLTYSKKPSIFYFTLYLNMFLCAFITQMLLLVPFYVNFMPNNLELLVSADLPQFPYQ